MSDQSGTAVTGIVGVQELITDLPSEMSIYTNVTSIHVGPEEIVLRHGLVSIDAPQQAKVIAKVYMSPGHAKRLSNLLASVLAQYEENFGTIAITPEDMLTPEARKRLGISEHE